MKQLQTKWILGVLVVATLAVSVLLFAIPAEATPANDLHSTAVAVGDLPETVRAKFMGNEGGFGNGTEVGQIMMVKFTMDPGGSFGWHQHGGPVWAIVTSGTLTIYDGDDPGCTPHLYQAGSALLDPGSDTHVGVNETDAPVEIYATFMLPADGETRIDADDPGTCR